MNRTTTNVIKNYFIGLSLSTSLVAQTSPDLPQVFVSVCEPTTTITKTVCAAGCTYTNSQLQQAIDDAVYGTEIVLQAGATYSGNFTLPVKSGTGWIVIRSSAMNNLPDIDTRVTPGDAANMPKIIAPNSTAAIDAGSQTHHYRLEGLEITVDNNALGDANQGGFTHYGMVRLGNDAESVLANQAHDFIVDRCYIHGHPQKNTRRGVYIMSATTAVINSYLSDWHDVGGDAQAILIGNSPGPIKVVNNFLEGSGENIMIGGVDLPIQNLIPEDIEFVNNYFYKPLSWKIGHASYAGYPWGVKNLFELKYGRRILIEGNIFENNWSHAQDGTAINMKASNQDGGMPWAVTEHVTFRYNIVAHSGSAFVVNGRDQYNGPTVLMNHMLIQHNVFDDINSTTYGGSGRFVLCTNGPSDMTFDHNTCLQDGNTITADVPQAPNFVFTNNIAPQNLYGIIGSGYGPGNSSIAYYFPNGIFEKNVLVGTSNNNPTNNYYPSAISNVGFTNYSNGNGGDYTLTANSTYKNAGNDGKDCGADITTLNQLTSGVKSGSYISCAISSGIKKTTEVSGAKVYPNPSAGMVYVEWSNTDALNASLIITDIQGREVMNIKNITQNKIQIATQEIVDGIYFITLQQQSITQTIKWVNNNLN